MKDENTKDYNTKDLDLKSYINKNKVNKEDKNINKGDKETNNQDNIKDLKIYINQTQEEKTKEEEKAYSEMVKKASPNTNMISTCLKAFFVGGLICAFGQLTLDLFIEFGIDKETAALYNTMLLVFLGTFLSGLGVYQKLGKFAGAGSIVPITGFANSMASPAIEFKKEGWIAGVGAKMFIIAGPVIVYGIVTSVVMGALYYFFG